MPVDIENSIDEAYLRQLWKREMDPDEKRRIRSRMYCIREQRLKDLHGCQQQQPSVIYSPNTGDEMTSRCSEDLIGGGGTYENTTEHRLNANNATINDQTSASDHVSSGDQSRPYSSLNQIDKTTNIVETILNQSNGQNQPASQQNRDSQDNRTGSFGRTDRFSGRRQCIDVTNESAGAQVHIGNGRVVVDYEAGSKSQSHRQVVLEYDGDSPDLENVQGRLCELGLNSLYDIDLALKQGSDSQQHSVVTGVEKSRQWQQRIAVKDFSHFMGTSPQSTGEAPQITEDADVEVSESELVITLNPDHPESYTRMVFEFSGTEKPQRETLENNLSNLNYSQICDPCKIIACIQGRVIEHSEKTIPEDDGRVLHLHHRILLCGDEIPPELATQQSASSPRCVRPYLHIMMEGPNVTVTCSKTESANGYIFTMSYPGLANLDHIVCVLDNSGPSGLIEAFEDLGCTFVEDFQKSSDQVDVKAYQGRMSREACICDEVVENLFVEIIDDRIDIQFIAPCVNKEISVEYSVSVIANGEKVDIQPLLEQIAFWSHDLCDIRELSKVKLPDTIKDKMNYILDGQKEIRIYRAIEVKPGQIPYLEQSENTEVNVNATGPFLTEKIGDQFLVTLQNKSELEGIITITIEAKLEAYNEVQKQLAMLGILSETQFSEVENVMRQHSGAGPSLVMSDCTESTRVSSQAGPLQRGYLKNVSDNITPTIASRCDKANSQVSGSETEIPKANNMRQYDLQHSSTRSKVTTSVDEETKLSKLENQTEHSDGMTDYQAQTGNHRLLTSLDGNRLKIDLLDDTGDLQRIFVTYDGPLENLSRLRTDINQRNISNITDLTRIVFSLNGVVANDESEIEIEVSGRKICVRTIDIRINGSSSCIESREDRSTSPVCDTHLEQSLEVPDCAQLTLDEKGLRLVVQPEDENKLKQEVIDITYSGATPDVPQIEEILQMIRVRDWCGLKQVFIELGGILEEESDEEIESEDGTKYLRQRRIFRVKDSQPVGPEVFGDVSEVEIDTDATPAQQQRQYANPTPSQTCENEVITNSRLSVNLDKTHEAPMPTEQCAAIYAPVSIRNNEASDRISTSNKLTDTNDRTAHSVTIKSTKFQEPPTNSPISKRIFSAEEQYISKEAVDYGEAVSNGICGNDEADFVTNQNRVSNTSIKKRRSLQSNCADRDTQNMRATEPRKKSSTRTVSQNDTGAKQHLVEAKSIDGQRPSGKLHSDKYGHCSVPQEAQQNHRLSKYISRPDDRLKEPVRKSKSVNANQQASGIIETTSRQISAKNKTRGAICKTQRSSSLQEQSITSVVEHKTPASSRRNSSHRLSSHSGRTIHSDKTRDSNNQKETSNVRKIISVGSSHAGNPRDEYRKKEIKNDATKKLSAKNLMARTSSNSKEIQTCTVKNHAKNHPASSTSQSQSPNIANKLDKSPPISRSLSSGAGNKRQHVSKHRVKPSPELEEREPADTNSVEQKTFELGQGSVMDESARTRRSVENGACSTENQLNRHKRNTSAIAHKLALYESNQLSRVPLKSQQGKEQTLEFMQEHKSKCKDIEKVDSFLSNSYITGNESRSVPLSKSKKLEYSHPHNRSTTASTKSRTRISLEAVKQTNTRPTTSTKRQYSCNEDHADSTSMSENNSPATTVEQVSSQCSATGVDQNVSIRDRHPYGKTSENMTKCTDQAGMQRSDRDSLPSVRRIRDNTPTKSLHCTKAATRKVERELNVHMNNDKADFRGIQDATNFSKSRKTSPKRIQSHKTQVSRVDNSSVRCAGVSTHKSEQSTVKIRSTSTHDQNSPISGRPCDRTSEFEISSRPRAERTLRSSFRDSTTASRAKRAVANPDTDTNGLDSKHKEGSSTDRVTLKHEPAAIKQTTRTPKPPTANDVSLTAAQKSVRSTDQKIIERLTSPSVSKQHIVTGEKKSPTETLDSSKDNCKTLPEKEFISSVSPCAGINRSQKILQTIEKLEHNSSTRSTSNQERIQLHSTDRSACLETTSELLESAAGDERECSPRQALDRLTLVKRESAQHTMLNIGPETMESDGVSLSRPNITSDATTDNNLKPVVTDSTSHPPPSFSARPPTNIDVASTSLPPLSKGTDATHCDDATSPSCEPQACDTRKTSPSGRNSGQEQRAVDQCLEIETIADIESLEAMLLRCRDYETRSRIRARIRVLKKEAVCEQKIVQSRTSQDSESTGDDCHTSAQKNDTSVSGQVESHGSASDRHEDWSNSHVHATISSYGPGPTDERGLPMFGLRALRRRPPPVPSGNPPTDHTPSGNSPTDHTPSGNPLTDNIPSSNSPTDNIPSGNPLTGHTSSGNPPTLVESVALGEHDTELSNRGDEGEQNRPARLAGILKRPCRKADNDTVQCELGGVTESNSSTMQPESDNSGVLLLTKSPLMCRRTGRTGRKQSSCSEQVSGHVTTSALAHNPSLSPGLLSESGLIPDIRLLDEEERETVARESCSFLDDRSCVTGAADVIKRMSASPSMGANIEQYEGRSLLNKFIGSQLLLTGVESMMNQRAKPTVSVDIGGTSGASKTSPSPHYTMANTQLHHSSVSPAHTTSAGRGGRRDVSVQDSVDQRQSCQGHAAVIVDGVNINSVNDRQRLKALLKVCDDFDTRRKIRARMMELLENLSVSDRASNGADDSVKQHELHSQQQYQQKRDGASVSVAEAEIVGKWLKETKQELSGRSSCADPSSVHPSASKMSSQRNGSTNKGGACVSPFDKFRQLDTACKKPISRNSSSSSDVGSFRIDGGLASKAQSAKDMILYWCQCRLRAYKEVNVENFSTSWNDGMAFCALIHHFYPDAFDFDQLNANNRKENFQLAFSMADKLAGIYPLLDVEDMVRMRKPDWKSVFTYVQAIYSRLKDGP